MHEGMQLPLVQEVLCLPNLKPQTEISRKYMTGNPRPSQSPEHITSQGDAQKPLLPCPHYASASADPPDLQLRIQSHNQAIAHRMSMH